MTLDALIEKIPDYAKDIRLNLSNVLTPEGAPDLTEPQIAGVALAAAYATKRPEVRTAIAAHAEGRVDPAMLQAAKAAASIMGMNNVYYRFTHMMHDEELSRMPAKLRMTVIGNPGVPKVDFELMCLGVSIINGCGMCIESHAHEVGKQGVSKLGVQSVARIVAVIAGAAQALAIES